MNTLKENLKKFLTANNINPKTKTGLRVEISYCQGFIAALPEGEEKETLRQICGIFHFTGRTLL
jgi:hypothetical protein